MCTQSGARNKENYQKLLDKIYGGSDSIRSPFAGWAALPFICPIFYGHYNLNVTS